MAQCLKLFIVLTKDMVSIFSTFMTGETACNSVHGLWYLLPLDNEVIYSLWPYHPECVQSPLIYLVFYTSPQSCTLIWKWFFSLHFLGVIKKCQRACIRPLAALRTHLVSLALCDSWLPPTFIFCSDSNPLSYRYIYLSLCWLLTASSRYSFYSFSPFIHTGSCWTQTLARYGCRCSL